MRITEKVLNESITEVNQQLAAKGIDAKLSIRDLSGGGGKVVCKHIGKLNHDLTFVGEKPREVYNYLLGLSDGIAHVGKPTKCDKACKKSGNFPKSAKVNLQYKSNKKGVFNNLMIRCLEHEFDTTISFEDVEILAADIDTAHNLGDITSYETGRLLEQFKLLTSVAAVQLIDGIRPNSRK